MSNHIILLVQPSDDAQTRTYLDFSSPSQAWDAIVRLFEERLKVLTPGVAKITYDVQQLFLYLDNLSDISCLVRDKSGSADGGIKYVAQSKDYIKSSILAHLQRQAGGGGGGGNRR